MAASADPSQVSPKVTASNRGSALGGTLAAFGLVVVASFLVALTPDMFNFLGPFAIPVTSALVSGGAILAAVKVGNKFGYDTPDPLRDNTLHQLGAQVPPVNLPEPDRDGRHEA